MLTLLNQVKELRLEGVWQVLRQMHETGDPMLDSSLPMLMRLITAETEFRREKKTGALAKRARFRYGSSVTSVMTGLDRNLDKNLLDRLTEGRWIRQGQNLLITGPTGAGKSYLASALGRRACQLGMKTPLCTSTVPSSGHKSVRAELVKNMKKRLKPSAGVTY